MYYKLLVNIFFCIYGSTALLLDNDNDVCSITKFADCSSSYMDALIITNTSTTVSQEALYKFYCGPDFPTMITCMKSKLNPSCGPGTDNWNVRQSVSVSDPHLFDDFCRNDTAQLDMLSCQTKISQVEGGVNCITGETLNKTLDPTDICSIVHISLGCSFKYVDLMCPASMPDVIKEVNKTTIPGCKIQIETSPELTSCDIGMEKACDIAYNPPQILTGTTMGSPVPRISHAMRLFLCSSFGRAYLQCLEKVENLCKKDANSYLSNYPLIQQTIAHCS
ncbi:hypothetical protein ACF0H5_007426 [Mactra antiquata]